MEKEIESAVERRLENTNLIEKEIAADLPD